MTLYAVSGCLEKLLTFSGLLYPLDLTFRILILNLCTITFSLLSWTLGKFPTSFDSGQSFGFPSSVILQYIDTIVAAISVEPHLEKRSTSFTLKACLIFMYTWILFFNEHLRWQNAICAVGHWIHLHYCCYWLARWYFFNSLAKVLMLLFLFFFSS